MSARRHQRWFELQRLAFISEMLHVYGFINREHLMRKFGISEPQASIDFRTFERSTPKSMFYNLSTKRYEAMK